MIGRVKSAMHSLQRRYPYLGYGGPPPHYHPGPSGHPPPHMYPGLAAGAMFYTVSPAPPHNTVQVIEDAEPTEIVPKLPGETVELPWSTYRWVPSCLSLGSIPPGALRVGTDADGAEIFAGRAPHEGDILPAKVIPSKNACYVCWGGVEVLKDQFEVLVPAMFSWQFSTDGAVPPGAVQAGVTSEGEPLYYGRVTHDGCTTPGKIQSSHGACYYPFDGEEKSATEYEVLVLL